jgi:hypothetical protein
MREPGSHGGSSSPVKKSDDFLAQAKAAFSTAPADGMKKLAAAMAEAEGSE